jgi:hypothetical protein
MMSSGEDVVGQEPTDPGEESRSETSWDSRGVKGFLKSCQRWAARHFWELPTND